MANVERISVSLEGELLRRFDTFVAEAGFPNRSEAVEHLIRGTLVRDQWSSRDFVAGSISLVYDHQKPGTVQKLLDTQHDFCNEIRCSQHVHLDHSHYMEIMIVCGNGEQISCILKKLREIKGLHQVTMTVSSAGKGLT